jgi:hypothetical protein
MQISRSKTGDFGMSLVSDDIKPGQRYRYKNIYNNVVIEIIKHSCGTWADRPFYFLVKIVHVSSGSAFSASPKEMDWVLNESTHEYLVGQDAPGGRKQW